MDALEQEVMTILDANGGSMTYTDFYNAIAPENRLRLRQTLVRLKARGLVKQRNPLDPETKRVTNYVEKVV